MLVDLDKLEPEHLEELAALLRAQQIERAAKLAEMADRPALGYYRRWREAT